MPVPPDRNVPAVAGPAAASSEPRPRLTRALGLWDLVLLNIVAIVGLRWWLIAAGAYGYASLPLWILAFVCFFVPSGLAVIDLTTRYPEEGGIYAWTKHAFGEKHGFISGWCLWTNNLIYFPHLLIFTVGNLVFMLGKEYAPLQASPPFMAAVSLVIFWVVVWFNVVGLKRARWLNNLGAYGTWLPATVLIGLGTLALWRFGAATPFTASAFVPVFTLGTASFFANMCFGFSGLDLGALMNEEIVEPRRNVPRAIFYSGIVITLIYVLGTAALLVALPQQNIGLLDGVGAAIASVQEKMGFGFLAGFMALLIALGGVGGCSAWLAGCSRVPFVAGIDRYLPPAFGRLHPKYNTPDLALLVTGGISSLLILVGFIGVDVEHAYTYLADFTIVVYFIPYCYLFAALLKLGGRTPAPDGAIPVPGGRAGAIAVGLLGFVTTAVAIGLALIPTQTGHDAVVFEAKMIGGCAFLLGCGWILYLRGRRKA
jgi:amino acid transporter